MNYASSRYCLRSSWYENFDISNEHVLPWDKHSPRQVQNQMCWFRREMVGSDRASRNRLSHHTVMAKCHYSWRKNGSSAFGLGRCVNHDPTSSWILLPEISVSELPIKVEDFDIAFNNANQRRLEIMDVMENWSCQGYLRPIRKST